VTLTFKRDVNAQEAKVYLFKWLKPLIQKGIQFRFVSEIGKNLKFHYHGLILTTAPEATLVVREALFRWKHTRGFIYLSKGSKEGWVRYIEKDAGAPHRLDIDNNNYLSYFKIKCLPLAYDVVEDAPKHGGDST